MTKQVSKSRFKAAALDYLDEVEATGEPLVVTDHGRPVVRIEAVASAAATLARLRGCVTKYDVPLEPVGDDGWEVLH